MNSQTRLAVCCFSQYVSRCLSPWSQEDQCFADTCILAYLRNCSWIVLIWPQINRSDRTCPFFSSWSCSSRPWLPTNNDWHRTTKMWWNHKRVSPFQPVRIPLFIPLVVLSRTKAVITDDCAWHVPYLVVNSCSSWLARAYVFPCFPFGLSHDDQSLCWYLPFAHPSYEIAFIWPICHRISAYVSRCFLLGLAHDHQCPSWYLICGISSTLLPNHTNLTHKTIDQHVRISPVGLAQQDQACLLMICVWACTKTQLENALILSLQIVRIPCFPLALLTQAIAAYWWFLARQKPKIGWKSNVSRRFSMYVSRFSPLVSLTKTKGNALMILTMKNICLGIGRISMLHQNVDEITQISTVGQFRWYIPNFPSYSANKSDRSPLHQSPSSHGNYGLCFGQIQPH